MSRIVTFERETSVGTVVRSTVEALGENRVRVLEYYRKPRHSAQFRRAKQEEGVVLPFEQLGVEASYDDFFGLEDAA